MSSMHYSIVGILGGLHEKCISFVVLRHRPMGASLDMLFSVYWQHYYAIRSLPRALMMQCERPHKYHRPATGGVVSARIGIEQLFAL